MLNPIFAVRIHKAVGRMIGYVTHFIPVLATCPHRRYWRGGGIAGIVVSLVIGWLLLVLFIFYLKSGALPWWLWPRRPPIPPIPQAPARGDREFPPTPTREAEDEGPARPVGS